MLSEKMRNEKKRFEMIKNNKKSVFDESDYSGSKSASRNLRTIRAVEKYRSLRKKVNKPQITLFIKHNNIIFVIF